MRSPLALLLFLIACGLAMPSAYARSEDAPDVLFQQAGAAYGQGNFKQAIDSYEKIIRLHGYSASVLYNLGNSYAQDNKIGMAILCYERARRLSPRDPDILGNLQYLSKKHGLFSPDPGQAGRFFSWLGLNDWTIIAAVSLGLLTLSLAAASFLGSTRARLMSRIAAGCLIILAYNSAAAIFSSRSWQAAIVTAPKARLSLSPFPTATSIGTIQEGRQVRIGKGNGDYIYVTDETGRSGWIVRSAIEAISPEEIRRR